VYQGTDTWGGRRGLGKKNIGLRGKAAHRGKTRLSRGVETGYPLEEIRWGTKKLGPATKKHVGGGGSVTYFFEDVMGERGATRGEGDERGRSGLQSETDKLRLFAFGKKGGSGGKKQKTATPACSEGNRAEKGGVTGRSFNPLCWVWKNGIGRASEGSSKTGGKRNKLRAKRTFSRGKGEVRPTVSPGWGTSSVCCWERGGKWVGVWMGGKKSTGLKLHVGRRGRGCGKRENKKGLPNIVPLWGGGGEKSTPKKIRH